VTVLATANPVNVTLPNGGSAVLIYNAAATTAFFRLGVATGLTAALTDTPVPPGARMLVDAGPFVRNAAVVLSAGTGAVYFTRGDGDIY
jgi:hypothetical protein